MRHRPPSAGKGRPKGAKNKASADLRKAVVMIAENKADDLQKWIERTAVRNPGKAADLLLRVFEYCLPKVARLEVTGQGGGPIQHAHAHAHLTKAADAREAEQFYLEMLAAPILTHEEPDDDVSGS